MKFRIGSLILVLFSLALSAAAQVSGTGATNYIPIWTDSITLGDSTIFETQGMVGIGTATPAATLNVVGANGKNHLSPNAPAVLQVTGGVGSLRGTGGPLNLAAGSGGYIGGGGVLNLAAGNGGLGGFGGSVNLSSGWGGPGVANDTTNITPGPGGAIRITSGHGSGQSCPAGICGLGTSGGPIQITTGSGGAGYQGGNGGSLTLQPGAGGFGKSTSGSPGNVLLAPTGGLVGVGQASPAATLDVVAGGTTLADAWTTRSAVSRPTSSRSQERCRRSSNSRECPTSARLMGNMKLA